jgi:hypothetical protein
VRAGGRIWQNQGWAMHSSGQNIAEGKLEQKKGVREKNMRSKMYLKATLALAVLLLIYCPF